MKGGALLGLVGSNQKLSVGQPETDPEELAKRSTLQDSILTDADGKQKKLSDYRGSVVIVGFWATWSAPCLLELSTFGELANKYSSQGLKVIAVNIDEGEEGKAFARSFWEKKSLRIDSFFDAQKALAHQFDVEMLPSAFVLDRQGRLAFSGFGSNDWFSPMTVEFLEGLLAESADRSGADSADQSDSQSANPADGPSN